MGINVRLKASRAPAWMEERGAPEVPMLASSLLTIDA